MNKKKDIKKNVKLALEPVVLGIYRFPIILEQTQECCVCS